MNVAEKLTAGDHLLSDVSNFDFLVRLLPDCMLTKRYVTYDVLMLQLVCCLNLLLQQIKGSLVELLVIESEDL